jgi:hypothetical protein
MVMPRLSLAARLSAASPFTDRMRRVRKEAQLPVAARNQKGPELSARVASASPAMNSAGLNPFIALPACLSLSVVTRAMLAPPSDKTRRSPTVGLGGPAWRVEA